MISKSLLRFSPSTFVFPKYLTSWSIRSFSNTENEAIARILKKQQASNDQVDVKEQKAKAYKSVYMGKGPSAIVERRRLQQEYLEIQRKKKEGLPQYYETQGDVVAELKLYLEHHDPESQLIDALLNYYQIAFTRNDNLLYLDNIKEVHKKNMPHFKFPALKVLIGFEPEVVLAGINEIENYLLTHNFILYLSHKQNSAFAQQTVDFIRNTVRPNLDMLFWSPILTYENMFKGSPDTYRGNFRNYMLIRATRLLFQNVISSVFRNYIKIFKNREAYRKVRPAVLENLEEWCKRLDKKPFHGGEEPDEADFEMYALIKSKYNSRSFKHFLENKCPIKFYSWFVRMQMKCAYDPDRLNFIE